MPHLKLEMSSLAFRLHSFQNNAKKRVITKMDKTFCYIYHLTIHLKKIRDLEHIQKRNSLIDVDKLDGNREKFSENLHRRVSNNNVGVESNGSGNRKLSNINDFDALPDSRIASNINFVLRKDVDLKQLNVEGNGSGMSGQIPGRGQNYSYWRAAESMFDSNGGIKGRRRSSVVFFVEKVGCSEQKNKTLAVQKFSREDSRLQIRNMNFIEDVNGENLEARDRPSSQSANKNLDQERQDIDARSATNDDEMQQQSVKLDAAIPQISKRQGDQFHNSDASAAALRRRLEARSRKHMSRILAGESPFRFATLDHK